MDYRYSSHTAFQIEYHFVWVTKYRYKVLTGEVAERVRELMRGDMTSVRDQDCQGCGEQGPCAYFGELPADVGAQRNHEEAKGIPLHTSFAVWPSDGEIPPILLKKLSKIASF